jgi:plasmid stabilization system protein ParE
LCGFPEVGASRFDLQEKLRSVPVSGRSIYYRLDDKRILVVRILHKMMDVGRRLQGRS